MLISETVVGAQNIPGASIVPGELSGQTFYDTPDFGLGGLAELGVLGNLGALAHLADLGAALSKAEKNAKKALAAAAAAAKKLAAQAQKFEVQAAKLAAKNPAKAQAASAQAAVLREKQAIATRAVQRISAQVPALQAQAAKVAAQQNALAIKQQAALRKVKAAPAARGKGVPASKQDKQLLRWKNKCQKKATTPGCKTFLDSGGAVIPTSAQIKTERKTGAVAKKDTRLMARWTNKCNKKKDAVGCDYFKTNKKPPSAADLKNERAAKRDAKKKRDDKVVSTASPRLKEAAAKLDTLAKRIRVAIAACKDKTKYPTAKLRNECKRTIRAQVTQEFEATKAASGLGALFGPRRARRRFRYVTSLSPFSLPSIHFLDRMNAPEYRVLQGLGQSIETIPDASLPADVTATGLVDTYDPGLMPMQNLPPQPKACTRRPDKPICLFYSLAANSQQMLYTLIQQIMSLQQEIMAMLSELRDEPLTGGDLIDGGIDTGFIDQGIIDPYGGIDQGIQPGYDVLPGEGYPPAYGPVPAYSPYGGGVQQIPQGIDYGITEPIPGGFDYGGGADSFIPESIEVGGGYGYQQQMAPAAYQEQQAVGAAMQTTDQFAMPEFGGEDAGFDFGGEVAAQAPAAYAPAAYAQPYAEPAAMPTYAPGMPSGAAAPETYAPAAYAPGMPGGAEIYPAEGAAQPFMPSYPEEIPEEVLPGGEVSEGWGVEPEVEQLPDVYGEMIPSPEMLMEQEPGMIAESDMQLPTVPEGEIVGAADEWFAEGMEV